MRFRLFSAAGLVFLIGLASIARVAGSELPPLEPEAYRLDDYRSQTPATLDGQPGLTAAQAEALWNGKAAVFIDVLPHTPKPQGLAPGTVWREKPRSDIPGSLWLPDTGYGVLAPETEAYFRAGLAQASNGDLARKIVFYCLKNCWMSWNAAKRAKTFGYTQVFWYPDGTDGWAKAGLPLEDKQPFFIP